MPSVVLQPTNVYIFHVVTSFCMKDRAGSVVYDFEEKAEETIQLYSFSLEFPVTLRSPDYRNHFMDSVGEESLNELADLWLDAEENIENRIAVMENGRVQPGLLEQSNFDAFRTFYDTVNQYMDVEEEFDERLGDELEGYVTLQEVMSDRIDDFPRGTEDVLDGIESLRDHYLESRNYDFLRGY